MLLTLILITAPFNDVRLTSRFYLKTFNHCFQCPISCEFIVYIRFLNAIKLSERFILVRLTLFILV